MRDVRRQAPLLGPMSLGPMRLGSVRDAMQVAE
jgi:hypothetical protein